MRRNHYQPTGNNAGILVADCYPVLFYDSANAVAGAAHVGWRGAAGGIIGRVVKALSDLFGSLPANLYCAVGAEFPRSVMKWTGLFVTVSIWRGMPGKKSRWRRLTDIGIWISAKVVCFSWRPKEYLRSISLGLITAPLPIESFFSRTAVMAGTLVGRWALLC